jgi:hypothetical protein
LTVRIRIPVNARRSRPALGPSHQAEQSNDQSTKQTQQINRTGFKIQNKKVFRPINVIVVAQQQDLYSPRRPERPCGRSSFEINGYFPWREGSRGVKATTHFHVMTILRISGPLPPLPHKFVRGAHRDNFTFTYVIKRSCEVFDDDSLCQTLTAAKCSLSAEKAYIYL